MLLPAATAGDFCGPVAVLVTDLFVELILALATCAASCCKTCRSHFCCHLPAQAGLAVAAVLLGAVFLVTSGGGDFAPAPRASTAVVQQPGQAAQLGEEQRADLQRQLEDFEAQLAADSSNTEALEGAAVLHFRLGEYAAAEKQLQQLAAAKPEDADVLRVLAEAQAAQSEWPASVASYRKAWEASGRSSLEILQGLAGEGQARGAGGGLEGVEGWSRHDIIGRRCVLVAPHWCCAQKVA